MSAKQSQKMCKSPGKVPKNSPQQLGSDYEMISTNCTLIGSNNLNLCAKPDQKKGSPRGHQNVANFGGVSTAAAYEQRTILATKNSFSAISNGAAAYSPNYPNSAVSPYNVQISSPANSVAIKSPVASPQQIRPPTPQPILPQAFQQIPVMTSGANLVQIIHNNAGYQNHPVLARPSIPTLIGQNQQIKIKPPQNILPKPPSTSGPPLQPTKAPQTGARPIPTPPQLPQISQNPAQLVLPTNQAILPAAQPGTLLLNQMPLIVQQNTPHGVQLILRPSTPNSSPQLTKNLAPQNLILQQGGILQHAHAHAAAQRGPMQQPQQLVRVLTANGMIQQLAPTYITMNNQLNLQQLPPPAPLNQPQTQPKILTQNGQHILQNHPGLCIQTPVNQNTGQGVPSVPPNVQHVGGQVEQLPPPKRKPKKKKKIKEKLDLGSIMKLSGIGDEDDVMFESDNSESTNTDTNPPQTQKQSIITSPPITTPLISSPLVTSPLISSPLVTSPLAGGDQDPKQRIQMNQNLSQNLSDINAINQNLTQIGLIQNSGQNFLGANQNLMPPTVINQPDQSQNLANFLSTLQNQNFSFNKFSQAPPTFPPKQNGVPAPFNIQVQNFPNQNLILNQSSNTILAPNFPGNLTLNNGILQTGNQMLPNFMQVQQPAEQYPHQRTGGFKLALSEDGRLILQHDPNLNQDIQSQLLLQNIFGINLQGGNLVLTSVNQPKPPQNPVENVLASKKNQETKTVNILQNVISSSVSSSQKPTVAPPPIQTQPVQPPQVPQEGGAPYVVNLTPDQLETLKKNGQVSVNGQIIYMQRQLQPQPPKPEDKPLKSPKSKPPKKPKANHTLITQLQKPPVTGATNKDDAKPPENKIEANGGDMEQFLSNLNINTSNLSQLISEKLSQELPNVDHKILNIQAGPNVGQLVAKIDISPTVPQLQPTPQVKLENEGMDMPALVGTEKIYQRIQTIQLTPQKQQLLKNVQLQIGALTNRLQQVNQQKNDSNTNQEDEIQNALRHLYHEQQKILATGKLLPTVNPVTCDNQTPIIQNIQNIQNIPNKSNGGSFVTSLQPVVSSNQNQKIYYHNGNQIISLNPPIVTTPTSTPASVAPTPTLPTIPTPPQPTIVASTTVQTQTQTQIQSIQLQQQQKANNKKVTAATTLQVSQQVAPPPTTTTTTTTTTTSDKGCQMSPNVTIKTEPAPVSPKKPTYSKAQLIEQQLQTDQNGANNPDINSPFASKADACKRLVRYHCYNQPVLSEKDLNKADEIFELTARHFIGKFQGMVNKYKYLLLKESMREVPTSELMMIDRMFLAEEQQSFLKLQSDLKLQNDLEAADEAPPPVEAPLQPPEEDQIKTEFQLPEDLIPDFVSVKQETENETTNTDFNIKCGLNYFAQDESCDSVVYATTSPTKYDDDDDDDDDDEGGGAEPPKKDPKSDESYNTTKIIGNFEIEINNKGCNSQESYTKNFRQKIIENRETETGEVFEKGDDYDEWLCIQRELGYLPPDSGGKADAKDAESKDEKSSKRSNENRLETLKKFRVEKHNKSKKTGSIIGEVKFEVRIEHKKVGQSAAKKRGHYAASDASDPPKKQKTNEIQIKQEDNCYLEENFPELLDGGPSPVDGLIDTSIDEQVQSAIDSILNLQQIASMSLPDKDALANNSRDAADLMFNVSEGGEGLDDAVKSILS